MAGMGTIIGSIITVFLVMTVLITWSIEYGAPAATQSLNNTYQQQYPAFNNTVYNPLQQNIRTGINSSNNLAASSSLLGFALAFILPGLGNIMSASLHAPIIFVSFISILFSQLPLPGYNINPLIQMASDAVILGILGLFLSMWSKWEFL